MISSRPFLLPEAFLDDLVPVIVPVSILVVIGNAWTSLDNKSKNNQKFLSIYLSIYLSIINSFTFTPNIGNGILAV
jgi:hypothetical protein